MICGSGDAILEMVKISFVGALESPVQFSISRVFFLCALCSPEDCFTQKMSDFVEFKELFCFFLNK